MKTRLILTACASALLLGLPAAAFAESAAPAITTAAQGGVTVPPLGFTKRVLANGMEVYTARDASTSNVTVQVWYRVGSKDDPAGRSGFAHLFEHLLFKSTKNMPSETFD
ncbi:MAG: M16 family metallopeptidase, partial [Brevundimonas sp.]